MMQDPLGRLGSRFLLALIDAGGTVPPAIGLAAELVRRGHHVRVLADPTIEASARSAGCAFTPWTQAPHFDTRAEQSSLLAAMEGRNPLRALRAVRGFIGTDMTRRYAGDVIATVHEHPVDAVLADGLPGILIGAQSTGLPTAALLAQTYLVPTRGLPLMGTGWRPGADTFRRARDTIVPSTVSWLLRRTLPRLNAAAATFGHPPLHDVFELFDRCTRVLVMTSPSFDYLAPRLPANVRYVGPQLDDPRWAASEWRPGGGTEPLVLVATSSVFQHQIGLLRRVARALGELPVRGLMTTGSAVDPADIDAPPNVDVVRAAPHSRILRQASVVITHAGHGTVIKSLAAGVPLVCMPMGRDQKDNTVRALRHGVGVRLSQRSTSKRITAAVADVLDDQDYAAAARRFADRLAQEAATTPSAADEAEAMVRR